MYLLIALCILCAFLYWKYPWIIEDFKFLSVLIWAGAKVKRQSAGKQWVIEQFEARARKTPDKTLLIFNEQKYSYGEINRRANGVANFAMESGLRTGDVVALVIRNEPAFVWTFLGLSKLGVVSSLINTNLRAKSLQHCLEACSAKAIIVGQHADLQQAVDEVLGELKPTGPVYHQGVRAPVLTAHWLSFSEALDRVNDTQLPRAVRACVTARSALCYIYTSGTTGLPKPAIMAQDRALRGACIPHLGGLTEKDVFYTALPLYHSAAGIIGLAGVISVGCTLVLREKFSASCFWDDCRANGVTAVQYIGELCRFLTSQPKKDTDKDHQVRVAIGNGLRADIWPEFRRRFGISHIVELYAATEGNVGFFNLFDVEGSIGRCSPIMTRLLPIKFVKYDFETAEPVRDSNGRCVEVEIGEPGLVVGRIKRDMEFDGYLGKSDLTQKKLLRDVMKEGDTYFNTGDLMYRDSNYNVYFYDRIGDTFRWKGENVSTTEVANVLTDLCWIEDANVYGVPVPGADGKCGIVSLLLISGHTLTESNLAELYNHCNKFLANYARPRFVRIQAELQLTSTYKQQKTTLVKEGFDPAKVTDQLFYINDAEKTYSILDAAIFEGIVAGHVRL